MKFDSLAIQVLASQYHSLTARPDDPDADSDDPRDDIGYGELLAKLAEEQMPYFEDTLGRRQDLADTPEQVVLDALAEAALDVERARRRLRLLIAYARELTVDPPRLVDVAKASELSKSHVARIYTDDDLALLERYLGARSLRRARRDLAQRLAPQ